MSNKFDELFDQVSKPLKTSSSFDSIFDEIHSKSKPNSSRETSDRALGSLTVGGVSGIKSLPRSVTGLLKYGSKALARKGEELAEREGREISPQEKKFTDTVLNILGKPEEWAEKLGLPTYEETRKPTAERIRKVSGLQVPGQEEQTGLEKGLETFGSLIGTSPTPGGALASAGAGIVSGLGGEGGAQLGGAIGLPFLVQLISAIKYGKLNPTNAQLKEIYEYGKKHGLSESQLTPIIQSPTKRSTLGSLAQPTARATKSINASESAWGGLYDKLSSKVESFKPASRGQSIKIINGFENVKNKLEKSYVQGPKRTEAIKLLDDSINRLAQGNITPDKLIETWQSINKEIDWNSIKSGKKYLNALKEPMSDLFQELAPKEYKEFQLINKGYENLQKTANKVEAKIEQNLVKYGEIGTIFTGLMKIAQGHPAVLKGYLTYKGARLLATESMINPRLNGLMRKTLASASKGTKSSAVKALKELEEGLREFPEIYAELEH